jgi:hypothetical protein
MRKMKRRERNRGLNPEDFTDRGEEETSVQVS